MKKIVIVGSKGLLGAALLRRFKRDMRDVTGLDRTQVDLADLDSVMKLDTVRFDILINAAAIIDMEFCEFNQRFATLVNAYAPALMAMICKDRGAKFIHFSSNYVFNAVKGTPSVETDPTDPVSHYGKTKAQSEDLVQAACPDSLIVRTSWLFGPDKLSLVDRMLSSAEETMNIQVACDRFAVPTYTEMIAQYLSCLFHLKGIFHVVSDGSCSLQEYILHAVRSSGNTVTAVIPCSSRVFPSVAKRPAYAVLDNKKFSRAIGLPPGSWKSSVAEYVKYNRLENQYGYGRL